MKTFDHLTERQRQAVERGLCFRCERPRGDDGTQLVCREHASDSVSRVTALRRAVTAQGLCWRCRQPRDGKNKNYCTACVAFYSAKVVSRSQSDEYKRSFDLQGGVCAICKRPSEKTLVRDHCHATGRLRALLCALCNAGLGMFRDNPAVLRGAASYLEQYAG